MSLLFAAVLAKKLRGTFKPVYYESIKREPKIRGINKCRCDERLQTKTKEFTRLPACDFLTHCDKKKKGCVTFVRSGGETEERKERLKELG